MPTLGGLIVVIFVATLISLIVLLFKRVSRIEGITATAVLNEYDVKSFFYGTDSSVTDYDGEIWDKSPYNNNLELTKNRILIGSFRSIYILARGRVRCVSELNHIIVCFMYFFQTKRIQDC